MLDLSTVSVIQWDTIDPYRAILAIELCRQRAAFKEIRLFCSEEPVIKPAGIDFVYIPKITDGKVLSYIACRELHTLFSGTHTLCIQNHAYILNPDAWDNSWLQYDYIGAPWFWHPETQPNRVGNGGFALRSKKFCEVANEVTKGMENLHPEDHLLCVTLYDEMVKRGIKFAPYDVARRFSCENEGYDGCFGMHEVPSKLHSMSILALLYGVKLKMEVK